MKIALGSGVMFIKVRRANKPWPLDGIGRVGAVTGGVAAEVERRVAGVINLEPLVVGVSSSRIGDKLGHETAPVTTVSPLQTPMRHPESWQTFSSTNPSVEENRRALRASL